MNDYVLYGYKIAKSGDIADLNISKTPKEWVPERPANEKSPFGEDLYGNTYMNPSIPSNLTPAGTPKTQRGAQASSAADRLRKQDTTQVGYGIGNSAVAAYRDPVVKAWSGGKEWAGNQIKDVIQPTITSVGNEGRGLLDDAQKRWDAEKKTLENQWDTKLQGYKSQLANMAKKWGGTALAGGGSLLGLWALMNAMKGGQAQMTPQQLAYVQQMRRPMNQQIFR